MMINKFFKIFLFLFTINLITVKSINVTPSEVDCLNNLAANTGGYTIANLSSTFCSTGLNKCYANGSISEIFFSQTTTTELKSNDFSCFPFLYRLRISSARVSDTFFTSIPPYLNFLEIYSVTLPTFDVVVPKIYQLVLGGTFTSIKASSLKNVQSFGTDSYSIYQLICDTVSADSLMFNFGIYTDRVPDLTCFPRIKQFQLLMSQNFNFSTYDNILKFGNLTQIKFSGSYPIDFPMQLTQLVNPQYTYLYFSTKLNAPPTKIDLSNNYNGTDVSVQFIGVDSAFNINGELPFIKTPLKTNTFYVSGSKGGIKVFPNLKICENVTSYCYFGSNEISGDLPSSVLSNYLNTDLGINKLTGTVDQSWCKTKVQLPLNQLTGAIPDCFYCHLRDATITNSFSGNKFTNYNVSNSNCTYSQMMVAIDLSNKPFFSIYGKNLGFTLNNVKISPHQADLGGLKFSNGNFTGTLSEKPSLNNITLSFTTQPNLSWTLSLTDTLPVIDKITQDNNTLTIDGSYFSYDVNQLNVKVLNSDGNLECTILNSTFYRIICQLDYPIRPYGNKLLQVTYTERLSSTKSFNLQYTPIECSVPDCNGNGYCNDHVGECVCNVLYTTVGNQICTVANHYISTSSQVDSNTGGNIKLYGYYGEVYNSIQLTVDDNLLEIESTDPEVIEAIIDAGDIGPKKVELSMNGVTFIGYINPYFNVPGQVLCFNNCSSKGSCNSTSGDCKCNANSFGLDCSGIQLSQPKTSLNINSIPISLTNEQTGFYVSVIAINEINFDNGTIVSTLQVANNLISNSPGVYSILGSNEQVIAKLTFNIISGDSIVYNGNSFYIQNGINALIELINWNYMDNENVLQFIVESSIDTVKGVTPNNCNNDDQNSFSSSSMRNTTDSVNYFKINQKAKTLYGRIQEIAMVSNNPTPISTSIISNTNTEVKIAINLPHVYSASFESDFSLFLNPSFNSSSSCIEDSSDDSPNTSSSIIYSIYLIVSLLSLLIVLI